MTRTKEPAKIIDNTIIQQDRAEEGLKKQNVVSDKYNTDQGYAPRNVNIENFLIEHRLRASDVDMEKLVGAFMEEMIKGLEGKKSSLRMITTYIEADNEFITGVPVVAIDAGGTNFRTSLIRFNSSGQLEMGQISNFRMPGLEGEISGKEFFNTIAGYIRPFADRCDRIGFCFSYPTEILPNRDGRLIQFCKEVQAPEVVGQMVGESLLETLGTPRKQIVLLNDTVATLLAGKSASFGKSYDSYIGFILGTGTNTCYIEQNSNILKNNSLDRDRSQIINIESGNFGLAPRTDLDLLFDEKTINPGNYTFEKMFSGGYFGGLCLTILKAASGEGLFSRKATEQLIMISELSAGEASYFAGNPQSGENENILSKCFTEKQDAENAVMIIDTLIDRASKLVAANLAAVVLMTGKGKKSGRPVLITIEGTAFYKLHNLKERFERYFSDYLSKERKRYVEFTEVPQASLIGAALAAMIE